MDKYECLLALSAMRDFPMDKLRCFLGGVGGAEEFFKMSKEGLEKYLAEYYLLPESLKNELFLVHEKPPAEELLKKMKEQRINFITEDDALFPDKLKNIKDAPLYLYYSGTLPAKEEKMISIIGARNCSLYGKEVALCFSKVFAKCGMVVVSGMARGIDGFAHEGALSGQGKTLAVLGFGPDICYPRENYGLKQRIIEQGCLISEYAPGTQAFSHHFPARNRLIAALSDGLLVVEAAKKSGTLITVDFALEQGKSIYAVPGRIGDPLSEGCNELIKNGCTPVTDPAEILTDFGFELYEGVNNTAVELNPDERKVFSAIELYPKYMDELINETKLELNDFLRIIYDLTKKGIIIEPVNGAYIKTPKGRYTKIHDK